MENKTDLSELYNDKLEFDESDKQTTKRKALEPKSTSYGKKVKKVDFEEKDEATLKKEEALRRELILKIEDALQPDLLGELPEVQKLKSLKLHTLKLEDLKQVWQQIIDINGSNHPRHMIYHMVINGARKVEQLLQPYTMLRAPGFADNLEKNKEFKQKLHMWALDKFEHNATSSEMSILYSAAKEYLDAKSTASQLEEGRELWGNLKVADELVDQFSDL